MTHPGAASSHVAGRSRYSTLEAHERASCLVDSLTLTDLIYEGFDVTNEIVAASTLGVGDTVFVRRDRELVGLAICHNGASEANSDTCLVKFAAVAGERTRPRTLTLC